MGYINCGIIILVTSYAYNLEGSIMETATKKFVLSVAVCIILLNVFTIYTLSIFFSRRIEHQLVLECQKVDDQLAIINGTVQILGRDYAKYIDYINGMVLHLKDDATGYKNTVGKIVEKAKKELAEEVALFIKSSEEFKCSLSARATKLESYCEAKVEQTPIRLSEIEKSLFRVENMWYILSTKDQKKELIRREERDEAAPKEDASALRKAAIDALKNCERYTYDRITREAMMVEALRISRNVDKMEFLHSRYILLQRALLQVPHSPSYIIRSFPEEWETYIKEWRKTDWSPSKETINRGTVTFGRIK